MSEIFQPRIATRGRVELHSTLSAIAYRYIAPRQADSGFEGRYTLFEDFLQGFYIEAIESLSARKSG
jgi:hypothetical protein